MKKTFRTALSAAILLLAALMIAGTASAGTPGNASVTPGSNTTYSVPSSPGTSGAAGGYVTEINVSTTQQTSIWQGFWGNVTSSTIVLRDSAGYEMKSWAATSLANGGYVYATTKSTAPVWGSLTTTLTSTLDGAGYWNFGSKTDNITNTYTAIAGAKSFANTTVTGSNTTTVNTNFTDYVVRDQSGSDRTQIVWIAEINNDKGNFRGGTNTSDYELLVPVVAGDTYRFYLEIL